MSVSAPAQRLALRSRSVEIVVVAVVAAVAALGAVFADAAPTGTAAWDGVLKAVLAGTVVVAAAKAPRWTVIVMAAIAAAASFLTLWGLAAWVALTISIGSVFLDRRNRLIGAVASALAVQSVLRLPAAGFFGLQSLVAVVAVVPVLVYGYRYGTKRARRIARLSVIATAVSAVILLLVGSIALLGARSDVDRGVAAARRGLAAARSGETESVAQELGRAESALGSANETASSPSARLLRLLPVASQHQRTIETATAAGASVARDAAAVVAEADFASISLNAGEVDLSALTAMAPQLRATARSLEDAVEEISAADSPWLVAPLRSRVDELTREIEEYLPEIDLAAEAAEVMPAMLGSQGTRTYFVMFGTPAESREFGGFLGSWAVVSFDGGRLELGESGRIGRLYDLARESQVESTGLPPWYLEMARPTTFPQNLPSSPDFQTVSIVAAQVFDQVSEGSFDGFVYLDAHGLVDFLELTGPVDIPFQDEPLTANNAGRFFFEDQYRLDASDRTEVFDQLAEVAAAVVGRLGEQSLPGPEELGRVLGPAARGGHLQVVTFDEHENSFLRSVKLLRDFGRGEEQDFVGLVQTNALSNKIDLYLQRELDYRVHVDDEGQVTATATATLRSVIPADAPEFALGQGETRGQNNVLLSLYSAHTLQSVTIDGVEAAVRVASEFGLGRYLVDVTVPPTGEAVIVEYTLAGVVDPDVDYSLKIWHQPLVNSDTVSVEVMGPETSIGWSGVLVENKFLTENE